VVVAVAGAGAGVARAERGGCGDWAKSCPSSRALGGCTRLVRRLRPLLLPPPAGAPAGTNGFFLLLGLGGCGGVVGRSGCASRRSRCRRMGGCESTRQRMAHSVRGMSRRRSARTSSARAASSGSATALL
jgi:hypothetical protein